MIELGNIEQQLIWYSKDHYGAKGNLLDDLRAILSVGICIPPDRVQDTVIYEWVVRTFLAVSSPSEIRDFFLKDMFPWFVVSKDRFMMGGSRVVNRETTVSIHELIGAMVSKLSIVQIQEGDKILVDLGEKDPEIERRILEYRAQKKAAIEQLASLIALHCSGRLRKFRIRLVFSRDDMFLLHLDTAKEIIALPLRITLQEARGGLTQSINKYCDAGATNFEAYLEEERPGRGWWRVNG